jgi:hypothetical protein
MSIESYDDDLNDVRSVSTRVACVLIPCGMTRLFELINNREVESYFDGKSRRITLRSIKARRDRLLAEAAANRNPPPRHDGLPPARRGEKRKRGLETRAQANAEATT